MVEPGDAVVLWQHPESEHSQWLAAGCGTGTFQEHHARVTEHAQRAQSSGRRLIVVNTSVATVLTELNRLGLQCTPEGCEQALRRLYLRQ